MSIVKQLANLALFKMGGTHPIIGPMKVQWELTYHCNLKCRHCQIWRIPYEQIKKTTMSFDQQKAVVDDLAANGVRHVSFSGGEMFLQKTAYDLIAHAKARGMKVGGNSNAFLISEKVAAKIAAAGLDFLYISLDGDNATTHDYIRGVPGAFDRVFVGVANVKRANPAIKIFFNTTINRHNVGQLVGVAKLAEKAGVDGITIEMTNTFDKYAPEEDLTLTDDQLPLLRAQIKDLFAHHADLLPHQMGYFDEFETYLSNRDELYKYRCVAGYTSAQIHPNGDLYACPVAFEKLGNLTEQTFADIWYGEKADRCRLDIKEGRHPICWITCVSPANQYLSYLSPAKFYKLLAPQTLAHIFRKLV
jgi:MoaA/NifB/PqqE/SkfB family radical SAM enzyme